MLKMLKKVQHPKGSHRIITPPLVSVLYSKSQYRRGLSDLRKKEYIKNFIRTLGLPVWNSYQRGCQGKVVGGSHRNDQTVQYINTNISVFTQKLTRQSRDFEGKCLSGPGLARATCNYYSSASLMGRFLIFFLLLFFLSFFKSRKLFYIFTNTTFIKT